LQCKPVLDIIIIIYLNVVCFGIYLTGASAKTKYKNMLTSSQNFPKGISYVSN